MSLKNRQVSILVAWIMFVIGYMWKFHIEPPHDEEYGRWLFLSLLDTGLPWVWCSIPLGFVVLSLDTPPRTRRKWITAICALVVVYIAYLDFRLLLHPSPLPDAAW